LLELGDIKVVSRVIGKERLVRETVGGIFRENKGVGSVFHFANQFCKGDCNYDVYLSCKDPTIMTILWKINIVLTHTFLICDVFCDL
jgi:hypothetical protein